MAQPQHSSGVWNRLKPEDFQELQEYTKCKSFLLFHAL